MSDSIRRVLTLAVFFALTLLRVAGADPAALSTIQWRHDLQVLAAELPRVHPDPFHAVSEADWRASVAALNAKIPQLTRNQILVELMRLVARIGEVHTSLSPLVEPRMGFHFLPIRPYLFADGLYVRAADPAHAALVGARILRVGNAAVEDAYRAVAAVVARDNDTGAKNAIPFFLVMPEVLNGLGLVEDDRSVNLELEKDGRRFSEVLVPAGALQPSGHGPFGSAMPTAGWIDARSPAEPEPLWLSRPGRLYWSTLLAGQETAYIQYNGVVDDPTDPIASFFPRVIAEAERNAVDRLVLDVRANGGGNSFLNRPIVKGLIRSRFDRPGHLFVIIGRGTTSAAENLVADLERWTNALFVGEPTGSSPNQYGDHEPVRLPESGLVVMVSTLYHQSAGPRDQRAATAPQLPAEATFAQYRDGADPAMAVVTGYRSIVEALEPVLRQADGAELTRRYRAFKGDPGTSWIPTERDVNALGYRLLGEGNVERAIDLFRLNADSYPASANAHDSLGEAYARAGDRERAIESYRRALERDPQSDSARRALAGLGAGGPTGR